MVSFEAVHTANNQVGLSYFALVEKADMLPTVEPEGRHGHLAG